MITKQTKGLIAGSLWVIACLGVLLLNISNNKDQNLVSKKAWWSGQTFEVVMADQSFKDKAQHMKLDPGAFGDFGKLKSIFDQDGAESIAIYYLSHLAGVPSKEPFAASSIDPRATGELSPEVTSLLGSSITKLAQYEGSNIDKLAWVKLGQDFMDMAVSKNDQNPIPHIIRYYNNVALPDFLKRRELLEIDAPYAQGVSR